VHDTDNIVLDATITDDLLALLVLLCSDVMGKVVELLADLVAFYLSRDRSVGEYEFEPRDFAEVSAMTRELEVAFVVITLGGINGIGELAQSAVLQVWQVCDDGDSFTPQISVELTGLAAHS
jgi:hypothetical protein